jgi:hypothetical protein
MGNVPLIRPTPTQDQLQNQIKQNIGQLSMGIYAHAAAAQIRESPDDLESLRKLAKDSQLAARCYFEGLNIIQENQEQSK